MKFPILAVSVSLNNRALEFGCTVDTLCLLYLAYFLIALFEFSRHYLQKGFSFALPFFFVHLHLYR